MAFVNPLALTTPERPTTVLAIAPTRTEPAGLWVRVGSSLLDAVAVVLLGVVPVTLASGMAAPTAVIGVAVVLELFMSFAYGPVMLAFNDGATWGKQACQQRVVGEDGRPIGFARALVRELAKGLSVVLAVPCLASALMVGIRHDKRSLHDLIAGTRVEREVAA